MTRILAALALVLVTLPVFVGALLPRIDGVATAAAAGIVLGVLLGPAAAVSFTLLTEN